ncbi:cardiolipin synthase (CMP-forming) [Microdochium nivale]|nr:cardiolipin synthase (CMP-forming) [Microdochium nivale]
MMKAMQRAVLAPVRCWTARLPVLPQAGSSRLQTIVGQHVTTARCMSTCRRPGVVGGRLRILEPRSTFMSTTRYLQGTKDTSTKPQTAAPAPSSTVAELQQDKILSKALPALTKHEDIYTIPNILTFSRFIIAPAIGYAIVHDAHAWALGMFAYAGISDLLDGWIARRWKLQTVVGSIVDPMADKLLMTILTVSLAVQGSLPVWLAVIIMGRDIGLAISAIYYRYISLPPPKTFMRYWDFSLPSAEVRPTTISKYNTFLQLGLMGATMVMPFVGADVSLAMTALQYTVATTTIWSGLSYVFSKDAVRILSDSKKKNNNNAQ